MKTENKTTLTTEPAIAVEPVLGVVNLYLLVTPFRRWYVLSDNQISARNKLTKYLNDRGLSYEKDRVIISTKLIGLGSFGNNTDVLLEGNYVVV
jgi:hypothetical protein